MDADEQKVFLGKVAFQLNKKLESLGLKSVVVPGTKYPWEINCLTSKGVYSMSYYFAAGMSFYKPEGEHQLFMKMPPKDNFIAYPRTDASQTQLVAARRLAAIAFDHIVENEARPAPSDEPIAAHQHEEVEEDISFNSDYDYENDFDSYDSREYDEELESEKRQREEAERSASNWKTIGIVLLVIFVIAGLSRCGGQSLPDNCEYIQDPRGGYTECS